MTAQQASKMTGDVPVGNALLPDSAGPRAFPYSDTITGGEAFVLDLTASAMRAFISGVQSAWIDNSAGANELQVRCESTNQVIRVAAGEARFATVLLQPTLPKLTLTRADTGAFQIILLNVPVPPDNASAFGLLTSLSQVIVLAAGGTAALRALQVGGVFNSTRPTLINGQGGALQFDNRMNLAVTLYAASTPVAFGNYTNTDAAAATTALQVGAYNYGFNGSTYDRLRGDTSGLATTPHALPSSRWTYAAAAGGIVNTTTAVTIVAAAGAGVRNYVTGLQIDWDALTTASEICIRDGAAGPVLWRGKLPTGVGRREIVFNVPLRGSANTLLEVVTLTATGAALGVYVNAQGFQGV